ncbi:MAG TPA: hypothetical protein VFS05_01825 [Gemmatimonadaceae bacterium]|nr:hypothetical protein [Gemmatimonadaceae bacterium]
MANRKGSGRGQDEARGRGRGAHDREASERQRERDDREMDREALSGPKSEWMEASEPPVGAPMTDAELRGLDLLGHSSERGGAIPGVADTNPQRRNDSLDYGATDTGGPRRSPPEVDDIDQQGGLAGSGGVAGGARGNSGRSSSGAGDPERPLNPDPRNEPPESDAGSRLDLDHPGMA